MMLLELARMKRKIRKTTRRKTIRKIKRRTIRKIRRRMIRKIKRKMIKRIKRRTRKRIRKKIKRRARNPNLSLVDLAVQVAQVVPQAVLQVAPRAAHLPVAHPVDLLKRANQTPFPEREVSHLIPRSLKERRKTKFMLSLTVKRVIYS
jgi:hypothetical protein